VRPYKIQAAKSYPHDHPVNKFLRATEDELPPAEFRRLMAQLLSIAEFA
jgi:hypothetical protein